MPRFVILRHETAQGVHFDLMLEAGGALKTWSLAEPPQQGVEQLCMALADHRTAYLDYEGPISNHRGSVTRWDQGEYCGQEQTDELWTIELNGRRIAGVATLRRCRETETTWALTIAAKQATE